MLVVYAQDEMMIHILNCAVLINSGLKELCKKKDIPYIDNMPSFMFQNGSVNDSYLLPKGPHLSKRGTIRLIGNMELSSVMKYADNRKYLTSKPQAVDIEPVPPTHHSDSSNKRLMLSMTKITNDVVYFAGHLCIVSNYFGVPLLIDGLWLPHLEGAYQYGKSTFHHDWG